MGMNLILYLQIIEFMKLIHTKIIRALVGAPHTWFYD